MAGSQFDSLDRAREISSALAGKGGANVSVLTGAGVTITGTADVTQLNSFIVKVTDSGSKVWTISLFNVEAVGV